jgi:hypothetical protein
MKDIVITLVIAVVLIFIFKGRYNGNEPTIVTHIDTIFKHDITKKYIKGDSIPFVVLGIDTTLIHDTVRIVQDYAYVRAYSDTIKVDSSTFIINDTISQNKIKNRGFYADISQKTIKVETIRTIPSKNELYWGILADLRTFDNKVGIGVGLGFKVPKKGLFTISATTNQYSIGYYARIY